MVAGNLFSDFIVPPFTVLDARQGYWRERKHQWLSLGLQSEVGRESAKGAFEGMAIKGRTNKVVKALNISIFDPVLTEICYRWFCPLNGVVIDPFAGGSVRGIVASKVGRRYVGVDINAEQVEANEEQSKTILRDGDVKPRWIVGDSRKIRALIGEEGDFLFSCPPYFNLEVYTSDPNDLSDSTNYVEFYDGYNEVIKEACSLLKDNRFACFVVGGIRDENGAYYNFVSHTITSFISAGLSLYNRAILLPSMATLSLRVRNPFTISRKLGMAHQDILVFVKGDAKKATEACGELKGYDTDDSIDTWFGEEKANE